MAAPSAPWRPRCPRAAARSTATGLLVLPGGVDVHTHLDVEVGGVRTADDFESGTAAAACGGVTTICDYAWQAPWADPHRGHRGLEGQGGGAGARRLRLPRHRLRRERPDPRRDPAAGRPRVPEPQGVHDQRVPDPRRGAPAAVRGRPRRSASSSTCTPRTATCSITARRDHARRRAARPPLLRGEPARPWPRRRPPRRAIDYAELIGRRDLHRAPVLPPTRWRRCARPARRGLRVWAETRPIYLALTDERYRWAGRRRPRSWARRRCAPPDDQAALWEGLRIGRHPGHRQRQHLVDAWSRRRQARRTSPGCPYGVPGLETEMRVIYSEGVSHGAHLAPDLRGRVRHQPGPHLRAVSAEGHDRGGQRRRPGAVRSGADRGASTSGRLHSRAGYDPFHGFQLRGAAGADPLARRGRSRATGQLASEAGRGPPPAAPPEQDGRLSAPDHCSARVVARNGGRVMRHMRRTQFWRGW